MRRKTFSAVSVAGIVLLTILGRANLGVRFENAPQSTAMRLSRLMEGELFSDLENRLSDPNRPYSEKDIRICRAGDENVIVVIMSGGGYFGGYGAIATYDSNGGFCGLLLTERVLDVQHIRLPKGVDILLAKIVSARGTGLNELSGMILNLYDINSVMWKGVIEKCVVGPVRKGCSAKLRASQLAFVDMDGDGWADILEFGAISYLPEQPYSIVEPIALSAKCYAYDPNTSLFVRNAADKPVTLWPVLDVK